MSNEFQTWRVLFKKTGENWTTPADPVMEFFPVSHTGLLALEGTFCVSSDNDMLMQGKMYEVHEVTLPSWLSVEEWVASCVQWKYTWGCGVDPTWSESWQRGLLRMTTMERIAIVKLLKTKTFRSEFRKSMRDQVVAWLETPAADRKYKFPLSNKQFEAICNKYVQIEARQTDSTLYRNRNYTGVPA